MIYFWFLLLLLLPRPAFANHWEALLNNVVGYGENTTGGAGGTLTEVSNLNDSGAGSLRACAESASTLWCWFSVSGTINLSSFIHMNQSNKTIDGRGQDITIANQGIIIGWAGSPTPTPVSNIIIHNIKFQNEVGGRMIHVGQYASNVWIDHCTFQNATDEIVRVASGGTNTTWAPNNITISWNHFPVTTPAQGWADKAVLISSDPSHTGDTGITLTLHHNHYETAVRNPHARFAKIHTFNNYLNRTGIGVDALTDSQILSENDIYRKNPSGETVMFKTWQSHPTEGGCLTCKVVGPMLIDGATVEQINTGNIFVPPYSYSLDTADSSLQSAIAAAAGWQNVTFNFSEDGRDPLIAPRNLTVTPRSAATSRTGATSRSAAQ